MPLKLLLIAGFSTLMALSTAQAADETTAAASSEAPAAASAEAPADTAPEAPAAAAPEAPASAEPSPMEERIRAYREALDKRHAEMELRRAAARERAEARRDEVVAEIEDDPRYQEYLELRARRDAERELRREAYRQRMEERKQRYSEELQSWVEKQEQREAELAAQLEKLHKEADERSQQLREYMDAMQDMTPEGVWHTWRNTGMSCSDHHVRRCHAITVLLPVRPGPCSSHIHISTRIPLAECRASGPVEPGHGLSLMFDTAGQVVSSKSFSPYGRLVKNPSVLRYQHLIIYCLCHNVFVFCLK